MFCNILLRSSTVVKFFDTLDTAYVKMFSCKCCIVTDSYKLLPLMQAGNYGFMPCGKTVMLTCLPWAICSLFLMLHQNVNSNALP